MGGVADGAIGLVELLGDCVWGGKVNGDPGGVGVDVGDPWSWSGQVWGYAGHGW